MKRKYELSSFCDRFMTFTIRSSAQINRQTYRKVKTGGPKIRSKYIQYLHKLIRVGLLSPGVTVCVTARCDLDNER